MATKFVQMQDAVLQSGISTSDTSATFLRFQDIYGNDLDNNDFGDVRVGTLERNTSREEIVLFSIDSNTDGVAEVTLTRGLSAKAPYENTDGTTYSHPAGSTLTISDNPQLLNELLARDNDEEITGLFSVPDPVSPEHIANRRYVLSVVTGGDVSFDNQVVPATGGEAISEGDAVYFDVDTNEWYKTDATDVETIYRVKTGVAQGAGSNGNSITGGVLVSGIEKTGTYTSGEIYYASNTPGTISTTAGDNSRIIGVGTAGGNLLLIDILETDGKGLNRSINRIEETASAAQPAINTDRTEIFRITALDVDITDMSANLTGSPSVWDTLVIEIIGTNTRSITWGTDFADGGVYNLPAETQGTTPLKCIFQWNGSDWVIIGIA